MKWADKRLFQEPPEKLFRIMGVFSTNLALLELNRFSSSETSEKLNEQFICLLESNRKNWHWFCNSTKDKDNWQGLPLCFSNVLRLGRYLSRYFEIGNVSYLIKFNTSLFICKIHILSYPRDVLGMLRTYLSIVTFVVISDSMQCSSKRRACLFHRIEFREIYRNVFQNTVQIFLRNKGRDLYMAIK